MKILFGALCALLGLLPVLGFPTPEEEVPQQCIDPTFACQDLQSAKICKVVKTCIHDVWSSMSVPDSNDEVCDICKEMVKEARDQLLSNMTQEEIKEVFEGSCKLLPIKIVADACIKVVDEIIPQLVEMLASRMDPTMVCTVSGMCFPSKDDMTIEKHILKFVKDYLLRQRNDQCSECTQMMSDVQVFLKSSTQDKVKTYVENLCHEKLPSYLCDVVVNFYFLEIYNLIANTEPEELCASVGVCPRKCEVLSDVSKVDDELTCEFCEHLLKHVIDLITANTTVEEFRTALLNFCNHTGKFADKCEHLVNDYYDMLFSYIKQLDTRGICTLIGLCDKTSCSRIPLVKVLPPLEHHKRIPLIQLRPAQPRPMNDLESFPLVKLVPAEMVSKKQIKESNDVFQLPIERMMPPLMEFQKDTECALCKAFAFYLEKELEQDRSKVGIQNAIAGICEKWMIEYPDPCNYIVSKYSLKMQMAIAKGISFDSICVEVKMCPIEQDKTDGVIVKVVSNNRNSPLCKLCKDALTDIENVLNDPDTKKIIVDGLDKFCNVFPDFIKNPCISLINSNVDRLLDILQQELRPENVCPALGVCADQLRVGVSPRVKDLECDVCKNVVTSFRTKLQDPASKEMIMTFLEEGCMRLPDSVASECKKFVDDNIDNLLKIIVDEMDPEMVCSILKICQGKVKVEKPKDIKDVECDLCKVVVGKVEDLVKDNKTEDEIKSALDKVCSYLPHSISSKCVQFVDQYTDILLTMLMQEMSPDMICEALNLCLTVDLECQGCQYLFHFLQEQLMNNDTEEEVKNVLKRMCEVLPKTYADNCEAFVNEYGASLLVLVAQEIDPSVVCYELKLCKTQFTIPQLTNEVSMPQLNHFHLDECSVCTTVVDYMDKLLEMDDFDTEMTKIVEKVCVVLPTSYQDKCSSLLETYGPYILQMIGQVADSKALCQEIDMCPGTAGHVYLIGGSKCTFGPSYWCHSTAHAAACKAEEYCKNNVWLN